MDAVVRIHVRQEYRNGDAVAELPLPETWRVRLDDALLTAAREREDDPFVANALCLCGLTRGWPADMLTALAQRSLRRWTDLYLDDLPAHLCLALIAARSGDREAFAEQRRILDFLGASILPALHRAEQSDPESLALHQVVLGLTPR